MTSGGWWLEPSSLAWWHRPVLVHVEQTVRHAVDMMTYTGADALPALAEDGRLAGVLMAVDIVAPWPVIRCGRSRRIGVPRPARCCPGCRPGGATVARLFSDRRTRRARGDRGVKGPDRAAGRSGFRDVPHTADSRVEAWAPTREECLAQAVRGVCASFLNLTGAAGVRRRDVEIRAERDEDVLVALLDEVVYRLDMVGEVPVDVELAPVDRGVKGVFQMADAGSLPVTGAAPKAVTLHGLALNRGPDG
ncbi:archease [Streptomyces flavochromogenes]|uniref:Archease n=1 Tax=Streptomyces flavochromogenes TaxID=68199 RepID=A0ABW6Y373_9ACTN